jgi:pimeloyl-ACP methyl ester carboxylesterase
MTVQRCRLFASCATVLLALSIVTARCATAQVVPLPTTDELGIALEGYPYPYPVKMLPLVNDGQPVRMAYMDVPPSGPSNGRSVVLLHGKNFFGAYWKGVIDALSRQGYRVVVPDQIGFGKSSKPDMRYSFDQLASNTIALADALGIRQFDLIGHSMGGMLAVHLARAYSQRVSRLVLEDPIGLEDYRLALQPMSTRQLTEAELKITPQAYRAFFARYYVHDDPSLIDPFVKIRDAQARSGEFDRLAKASALTYQMILQQPTVYEMPYVDAPTLLIVGADDHTIVAANYMTPEARARYGHIVDRARDAVSRMKHAQLIVVPGAGHIPHLEQMNVFLPALLNFLGAR